MKKPKGGPRPKIVNTRKAIRKEKRQQKKLHKQVHYQKKKLVGDGKKFEPGKFVKLPTGEQEISKADKKKKNKKQPLFLDILNKERQKDMNVAKKLKSEMEEQRRQILLKANEDEDKIVAAEKHLADVEGDSDFEEDLAVVTGKKLPDEKEQGKEKKKKYKSALKAEDSKDDFSMGESDEQSMLDDDENVEDEEFSDLGDEEESNYESEISEDESKNKTKSDKKEKIISEDDLNKVFSDDEVSHLSGDEDLDGSDLESGEVNVIKVS
ncbi:hypothetical protein RR46_04740 [Papilio xuthus]|uniref:Uncharacterized protein n=1 Tax=Papilio xuthus TaxID=66420 RepID=A0A194Q2J5_PAPXU|nr:hypothetical protein RR46_04740 [Papilio xuthus]